MMENMEHVPGASQQHPVALTIAGSDSGAGAGIQADLKTFSALGVYGATALTLVTAQNTRTVSNVYVLPPAVIRGQLEAVFTDFRVAAAKTGALGAVDTICAVVEALRRYGPLPLVVDPVMISKHGQALLHLDAVAALREELLPLATVVTPNLAEAAALAGMSAITDRAGMQAAAERIAELGCAWVVVKGGHMEGSAVDLAWHAGEALWLEGERVATPHTHGTGCTFSAAITAGIVRGLAIPEAVREAKAYVTGGLKCAQVFGQGINPVNHFWQSTPRFGAVPP
jgi:hydroxymethylpyrimidine/phosphomethylpyrimidine kinase